MIDSSKIIDPLRYNPQGDKKNSDYFEKFRVKIYERRKSSGLEDLLGNITAVVVQVQTGDALPYLNELYVMTPYRYKASYVSSTHRIYCLVNQDNFPAFFVLEPLNPLFEDDITRINRLYPNSRTKCNARYVGEIFYTKDKNETKAILQSHNMRFYDTEVNENPFYSNPNFHFTRMSDFTYNRVGYTDVNVMDFASLNLGQPFSLTNEQQTTLAASDALSIKLGVKPLIRGLDHLATRVLAGEREDALLEHLCLSNYYFWGAYDIINMNTSTNVNRPKHDKDYLSPAKVFTANDVPYMVNSFQNTPMPTEDFVRNYGRRLHHMAYEIIDGDYSPKIKNIDYVIGALKDHANIKFLSAIVGACDAIDLRQVFAKHSAYSTLITEYVERCHHFNGFFSKENVTALTGVAAADELLKMPPQVNNIAGD